MTDDVIYRIEPQVIERYVDGVREVYFAAFDAWIAIDRSPRQKHEWVTDSLHD